MAEPGCPKMRTILVAIDDSEHSLHALKWALNTLIVRSEHTQVKIVLIHAKLPPARTVALESPGASVLSVDLLDNVDKAQDRAIADFMNRAAQICHEKQIPTATIVERGDAREVICDTVEKVNADFLVIGSHGYGMIKRAVLGSVSDYCAHHAKCPVVIVKKPHKKSEATEDVHQHTT